MPHLSPMSWKYMALMVLLLLAFMSTSTWWAQLPYFPQQPKSPKPFNFPNWPWS